MKGKILFGVGLALLGLTSACGCSGPASSSPAPVATEERYPADGRSRLSYVGSTGITGCAIRPGDSAIREAVHAHHDLLESCINGGGPVPTGITVWVDVEDDGTVGNASIHARQPEDATVPACFVSIIEGLTFAAPGPGCRWTHQLEFRIDEPSAARGL